MDETDLKSAARSIYKYIDLARILAIGAYREFGQRYSTRLNETYISHPDAPENTPEDAFFAAVKFAQLIGKAVGHVHCLLRLEIPRHQVDHPAIDAIRIWLQDAESIASTLCDQAADPDRQPSKCDEILDAQLLGLLEQVARLAGAIKDSNSIEKSLLEQARETSRSDFEGTYPYDRIKFPSSPPSSGSIEQQTLNAFCQSDRNLLPTGYRLTCKEFARLFGRSKGYIAQNIFQLKVLGETDAEKAALHNRIQLNKRKSGSQDSHDIGDLYDLMDAMGRLPQLSTQAKLSTNKSRINDDD